MTRRRPRPDTDEGGGGTGIPCAVLLAALAIATLAGVVGATTVVVGFELFEDGTALTTEFEESGVIIPPQPGQTAGALVVSCGPQNAHCPEAQNGQNAAITPQNPDFGREPLEIVFTEPQEEVRLFVSDAAGTEGPQVARLEARTASGSVFTQDIERFDAGPDWHRLEVATDSPRIESVTVTLWNVQSFEGDGVPHNRLVADELRIVRPDVPSFPIDPWLVGGLVLAAVVGLVGARTVRSRDGEDGDRDNRPPRPGFTPTPDEPVAGRPVAFDGTPSVDPDPDDAVAGYEWTIEGEPRAGQRVVHTFDEAGEYDVELTVTDRRGARETETATITVEEGEGELELVRAHPDAPGDDHENLAEEFLVFENTGEGTLELGGWTVHDAAEAEDRVTEGEHTFEFPDGLELEPDATVSVHTGPEPDGAAGATATDADHHCYWGRDWAVWNNEADVIVVENGEGDPVVGIRYERTDEGEYELEDLDPASLEDWFSAVEPDDGPSVGDPDVPTDVESGVTSRLRDLLAGLVFRRGPRGLLVGWSLVAVASALAKSGTLLWISVAALGIGVAWAVVRRIRS